MRYQHLLLLASFAVVGCGNEDVPEPDLDMFDAGTSIPSKGKIDMPALKKADWPVTLNGDLAEVIVPLSEPVPGSDSVDDFDTVRAAFVESVSLLVQSDESKATAKFATGKPVEGVPAAVSEFSWKLNSKRDKVTITFWNESATGLTLKAGKSYTVQITINTNDYIETLPTAAFTVVPE